VIWHLVLMKPRPDLGADERQALVDAFDRAVREIEDVRGVRVGRRIVHGAGYEHSTPDAEYAVVIDFEDVAALQRYLRHPAHEELGRRFGAAVSSAAVYDFEDVKRSPVP